MVGEQNSLRVASIFGTRFRALAACSLLLWMTGCLTTATQEPDLNRDSLAGKVIDDYNNPNATNGTAKVAILLPLSGPYADIGRQLMDASLLAMFDKGDDTVELLPRDTKGTPEGAAIAVQDAISDGADIVVGPLFSHSVTAVKPFLRDANIRAIALSNNRAVAGSPVYLIGNQPEPQVDALTTYLRESGKRRIALLGPDTSYLRLLQNRLIQADKVGNIRLVDSRLYPTNASYTDISKQVRAITQYSKRTAALADFTAIFESAWEVHEDPEDAMEMALEQLEERVAAVRIRQAAFVVGEEKSRKKWMVSEVEYGTALTELLTLYQRSTTTEKTPQETMTEALTEFRLRETLGSIDLDAVILPIGGQPLLVIAPMFEYFNATQPDIWMVGTDVWDSADLLAKKDLFGSRYVTTASENWADFQSRVESTFQYKPEQLVASAYDAVAVALLEKQETGLLAFDETFLTRAQGFEGINGQFGFLSDGVAKRMLHIVQLRDDGRRHLYAWQPSTDPAIDSNTAEADPSKIAPLVPSTEQRQGTPPISFLPNQTGFGG
jgi:Periplasmic binding protein